MSMNRWYLLAGILLATVATAGAQVAAQVWADSNRVETGNPYLLHFSIPTDSGMPDTVHFDAWQDALPEENVLQMSGWHKEANRLLNDVTVIFFEADTLSLSPLPIRLINGDTALTNPLEITVYATPSGEEINDLKPIKDILREPVVWTDYLPLLAILLAIVVAGFLIYLLIKRYRNQSVKSRTVGLPPHLLALKKLEQLKRKEYWQKGQIKEYCAEITFILREYFAGRYGLRALESTSDELLQVIQATDFPTELLPDLQTLMVQADLAKFAKVRPANGFYEYSMNYVARVIQQAEFKPEETDTTTDKT